MTISWALENNLLDVTVFYKNFAFKLGYWVGPGLEDMIVENEWYQGFGMFAIPEQESRGSLKSCRSIEDLDRYRVFNREEPKLCL